MTQFTYRYCQYIPSLLSPDEFHDFAVVVACDDQVALVGIDAAVAYKLGENSDRHPTCVSSFGMLHNRLLNILRTCNPATGHVAIESLDSSGPTNIMLSPIGKRDADGSALDLAHEIFKPVLQQVRDHHKCQTTSPMFEVEPVCA